MKEIIKMKQEFIDFLNALMEAAPEVAKEKLTDNVQAYIDALMDVKQKPALTDNGKMVLQFLQNDNVNSTWRSKDVAEQLFVSSRTVSGAFRKLVTDGFCERIGKDPVLYTLTEKGKTFKIDI